MKQYSVVRRALVSCLALGLVGVAACDDDPLDPDSPSNFGEIGVSVTTAGYEPDFVDYQVAFEGGGAVPVESTGDVVLFGAPSGSNNVELRGVPDYCTVTPNPATVSVTVGERADVSFDVTCTAVTGGVNPTFAFTGVDPDASVDVVIDDGLATEELVTIDPTAPEPILNLAPGDRTVTIENLAENCTAVELTQTVSVTAGANVDAPFAVDCVPNVGTLTVGVTTTGTNIDANYTLTIDDLDPFNVGPNGNNEFNTLAPGPHTVILGDVAENCAIVGTGANRDRRTPTVVFNDEVTVSYEVTCE